MSHEVEPAELETFAGREEPCPSCGSRNVAEIVYGLILDDDEFQRDVDAGEAILGGCIVGFESPQYRCNKCRYPFGDVPDVLPYLPSDAGHP